MLTASEVAQILRISEARVYELIRLGILPHVRLGRQIRVDQKSLEDFIKTGGEISTRRLEIKSIKRENPAGKPGRQRKDVIVMSILPFKRTKNNRNQYLWGQLHRRLTRLACENLTPEAKVKIEKQAREILAIHRKQMDIRL